MKHKEMYITRSTPYDSSHQRHICSALIDGSVVEYDICTGTRYGILSEFYKDTLYNYQGCGRVFRGVSGKLWLYEDVIPAQPPTDHFWRIRGKGNGTPWFYNMYRYRG